ncbi:MAG: hypothetical protein WD426_16030 [Anditalea sp.]
MNGNLLSFISLGGKKGIPPLLFGALFLIIYWLFGYDGITFSDEVAYLKLGDQLWNLTPVIYEDHFSSRWGTYLFPGLFTHLFGFHDRNASIASLLFYLATLFVLWKITPSANLRKWVMIFFISHIYLLHFLPKVYPDTFLIFWVVLIPVSALFRDKQPILAALVMSMAFVVGFCTKETMVLLFPFPLLLLFIDLKWTKSLAFYYYFALFALLLIILYLGYYQLKFGDMLFQFKSIHRGHYISGFSYHDKGWIIILKRITYLPFFAFIERTYWLWLVMAIPGIFYGLKSKGKPNLEFALCSICLLIGFWLMTTSLEFYNPIPLNPRHFIIMVGPLSVNIALGAKYWLHDQWWKRFITFLLMVGGFYAFALLDWKIGAFHFLFAGFILLRKEKLKYWAMTISLILTVTIAVYHQHQLKNYPHFLKTFQSLVKNSSEASPLLTHEFIVQSKDVLLNQPNIQAPLQSLYHLDGLKETPPHKFTLFVYNYYRHAYVKEQEFLDKAEEWIKKEGYEITSSSKDQWMRIEVYEK